MAAVALHAGFFPLLGYLLDDGCYLAYAEALRHGLGYVDPSMPVLEAAKRYPPGFPALLALVMMGVPDVPSAFGRLAWVSPLAGGTFLVLAVAYLRTAGWPSWAALGGAALLGLGQPFWNQGTYLWSDLVFAALSLGALLLLDRRPGAAGGLLLAASCAVRYAGVALVLAVAEQLVRSREPRAWRLALAPVAIAALAWAAFRAHTGGENYAANFAAWSGGAGALPARLGASLLDLLAALPALFALPGGAWAGALLAAAAAVGAWRVRGTAAAYVGWTALMALIYQTSFLWFGAELPERLLLPVAPVLLALLARGVGQPRLAAPALAAALLLAGWGWPAHHGARLLDDAGVAEARQALAFAREHLPPEAVVLSPRQKTVYLYSGRRGYEMPVDSDARGRPSAVAPLDLLMTLAHWHATHLVALPEGRASTTVPAIQAFAKAYPGVLAPLLITPHGNAAVFAIRPAPFAAACQANKVPL